MTKPLLILDPHPRPRRRIFDAAQWARLNATFDVAEAEDGAPMPARWWTGTYPAPPPC